jgi:molybdate transport system substrate-binding protein
MSGIGRFLAGVLVASALGLALGLTGGSAALAADVTVFAAASLKNALEDIREEFEAETGYTVTLSLAGSSVLARQIALGAPADIYLPASSEWMDYLEAADRLVPGSRVDLVGNRLVLIAPQSVAQSLSSFEDPLLFEQLGEGKLAMGLLNAVPAGIYGQAALQSLGLWQRLAPQVAQTDNVRAALALVASAEAPLGIVYASDARVEPRVVVLAEFPKSTHAPIRYPLAQILPADRPAVVAFHAYLQGRVAREVFLSAGFDVIAE